MRKDPLPLAVIKRERSPYRYWIGSRAGPPRIGGLSDKAADGYPRGMREWIIVTDKNPAGSENIYINVDAIDCVREDATGTHLTLRSGRVVRTAFSLESLQTALEIRP